ncbi:hypothetical protein LTS18_000202, partial [Coniosporium uncinatum]
SSDDDDESEEEVPDTNGFKINTEYAKRFEHNKKREEKQRLEEKYGKYEADLNDDDSSSDESEDDNGLLATEDLDAQMTATLQALRNKDPRVYDGKTTFYKEAPEGIKGSEVLPEQEKKEKPMYLKDYHRKNLLEGNGTAEEEPPAPPKTYVQEQATLKNDLVKEMHAAADSDAEEDFLVRKKKSKHVEPETNGTSTFTKKEKTRIPSPAAADADPEGFLSNFMAARAWVPDDPSRILHPFESDDEEEDERAEQFEHAYNLRFEDPEKANEKLMSHARDAAAKYSVRREELNPRKKKRESEREKREAEKREREVEISRLRKLKVDEMEERVKKIREAAGLKGRDLNLEQWKDVLEGDWDDE